MKSLNGSACPNEMEHIKAFKNVKGALKNVKRNKIE